LADHDHWRVWLHFVGLAGPLDKGVPMQGTVAKEGSRKTIQHQTGGTIQEILVKMAMWSRLAKCWCA
jgi:hypothetical protein